MVCEVSLRQKSRKSYRHIELPPNFHDAYNHEFRTAKLETRTEHIRHIRLAGDFNNNKMERMNGEIRDRERVMRGLEKKDTPILMGYQLFHNFIRPHMALDGKTPVEVAGIKVEGENKWVTLIQNASVSKTSREKKIGSS
jgi:hypothetical protein